MIPTKIPAPLVRRKQLPPGFVRWVYAPQVRQAKSGRMFVFGKYRVRKMVSGHKVDTVASYVRTL